MYGVFEQQYVEELTKPKLREVNESNEILNEETVYYDSDNSILITVDGDGEKDRGFINDPYFKIYNNKNQKAASKEARISMKEPKYIYHKGKPQWNLSSRERKKLNEILNSIDKETGKTVWEKIKNTACKETEHRNDEKLLNLPIIDYSNIN